MAAAAKILELDSAHARDGRVIDDIVRMEKRIFPKHESLPRTFHDELKYRNTCLIYSAAITTTGDGEDDADGADEEEEVIGYAMYTCATSLCASITKLAVKESRRRQGHGEALLMAAVESCRRRRVQRVSLHIDPARAAAVALYRKVGFQVDATVVGLRSTQGCIPDVNGSQGKKSPAAEQEKHADNQEMLLCSLPIVILNLFWLD